jgi:hypothetical protein
MPLPTPQATWSAIAARLEGVERTAMTYAGYLGNSSAKAMPGADDVIFDACVSTWKAIQQFRTGFGDALPPIVSVAIDTFASANGAKIVTGGLGADFTAKRVIVMKLMLLGGEITHGMNDHSEEIRSAAELAFKHLQQMIVVDQDVRAKWKTAYIGGETDCEKLGGVHLLWHGIQAFKAHATGGRTDLILPEPLKWEENSGVRGLVLTEWKKGDRSDVSRKYEAAKRQAVQYASGALGGVELRRFRFLVLVTEKAVTVPADEVEDGVTFRYVNIAVDPDSPSVAAVASR